MLKMADDMGFMADNMEKMYGLMLKMDATTHDLRRATPTS